MKKKIREWIERLIKPEAKIEADEMRESLERIKLINRDLESALRRLNLAIYQGEERIKQLEKKQSPPQKSPLKGFSIIQKDSEHR